MSHRQFPGQRPANASLLSQRVRHFVEAHCCSGLTLDLGCGDGPYADLFPLRIGMDSRPGPGVDVVGDIHTLPFEDERFDIILCTEVIEHLHSPHSAVAEMHRVLKCGGRLILTTRFVFPLHDVPHDFYRYTHYGLRHLFKTGWEIVELRAEARPKDCLALLLQRIVYQSTFRCHWLTSRIVLAIARLLLVVPDLSVADFGNRAKTSREDAMMTSGYHLICRKV